MHRLLRSGAKAQCRLVFPNGPSWVSWGRTPVLRPTSTSARLCPDAADSVARRAGPGGPREDLEVCPTTAAAFTRPPISWLALTAHVARLGVLQKRIQQSRTHRPFPRTIV